ncbi:MAG: hydrogenase maturation protease [Acidobacteriota bacterium]
MAEGSDPRQTLIAALGNPLMGDDGAGAAVLEELRRRGAARRARLCNVGAAGVDLLLELESVGALILLDAVAGAEAPGTVRVFRDAELFGYAESRGGGSHQPSLADTLRMAERLGIRLKTAALVGIAAAQFELGRPLSPEVAAAVPQAADAAERLLDESSAEGC